MPHLPAQSSHNSQSDIFLKVNLIQSLFTNFCCFHGKVQIVNEYKAWWYLTRLPRPPHIMLRHNLPITRPCLSPSDRAFCSHHRAFAPAGHMFSHSLLTGSPFRSQLTDQSLRGKTSMPPWLEQVPQFFLLDLTIVELYCGMLI